MHSWQKNVIALLLMILGLSIILINNAYAETLKTKTNIKADNVTYDATGNIIGIGNVEILKQQIKVTADKLFYNVDAQIIYLEGHVVFIDGNQQPIYTHNALLDQGMHLGVSNKVITQQSDGTYILADSIDKKTDNVYNLNDIIYTACDIKSKLPSWEVSANSGNYDGETLDLYNPIFKFSGTPVLWLPYFSVNVHKNDRQLGFLLPSFGSNSYYGAFSSIPFYVPLSAYSDLTLYFNIYNNTSPRLDPAMANQVDNWRILTRYSYNHELINGKLNVAGSYIKSYKELSNTDVVMPSQYHLFVNFDKDLNKIWRSKVVLQEATNIQYIHKYDITTSLDDSDNYFTNLGQLEGFLDQNSRLLFQIADYIPINKQYLDYKLINMEYAYLSPFYKWGSFDFEILATNSIIEDYQEYQNTNDILTNFDGRNINRLTNKMTYKYSGNINILNYRVEAVNQLAIYSGNEIKDHQIVDDNIMHDNFYDAFSGAFTIELPLWLQSGNFDFGNINLISQLSYIDYLDENNNDIFLDSFTTNYSLYNVFALNHYLGYDKVDDGTQFKLGINWDYYNNDNRGFTLLAAKIYSYNNLLNTDILYQDNIFFGIHLRPWSFADMDYSVVYDNNFNLLQRDIDVNVGYNRLFFSTNITEYYHLDDNLFSDNGIAELEVNIKYKVFDSGIFIVSSVYDLNTKHINNTVDKLDDSQFATLKSLNASYIAYNQCIELEFYTKLNFYDSYIANTFGILIRFKTQDGYLFDS